MVDEPATTRTVRFSLGDLAEQVEAFAQRWPGARADAHGRAFVAPPDPERGAVTAGELHLPLVGPRAIAGEPIGDYAERVALEPPDEVQLVLLLRASGMALGLWRGDELLQHKAVRKYVVRGNGKAQATHLKTRGKSRYGSRLRLQNWRSLLAETNERWRDLDETRGPIERVFWSAPVRVWSALFDAEPPPPRARDDGVLQRIPLHVHRPDHEELLRVRRELGRGRLELPI